MDIAELRKRAMRSPQTLTKKEWNAIFTEVGFTMPKQSFSDDTTNVRPKQKKVEKDWW